MMMMTATIIVKNIFCDIQLVNYVNDISYTKNLFLSTLMSLQMALPADAHPTERHLQRLAPITSTVTSPSLWVSTRANEGRQFTKTKV
jgi:hypothetical protein